MHWLLLLRSTGSGTRQLPWSWCVVLPPDPLFLLFRAQSAEIAGDSGVLIWVQMAHSQLEAASQRRCSPYDRCRCISTWKAPDGRCGELGSWATEPSYSQTRHPHSGSRKQLEVQTCSLAACRCLPLISGNTSKSVLRCRTQRRSLFPGWLTALALSPSVGLGAQAAGALPITQVLSR